MKKINKIQKIALGLAISGIVGGSAATTAAVILTHPSHNEHRRDDDLDMLHVPLKVQSKHVPTDFDDAASAPSEIMDYIKETLLSDDETLESVSGEVNYEDGTIITTVLYRMDDYSIQTEMFLFEGWVKAPRIDHRNTQLQAELFKMVGTAILPDEPTDPKYMAKFHALQVARTALLDRVANWKIPTKEILTPLVDKLKKLIAKFNEETDPNTLLQAKKDHLASIMIESKCAPAQGRIVTSGYPTYSQPDLTTATLAQVEQYITAKLAAKNAAHAYNEKLKETDKQVEELIRLKTELKSIHIPNKVVFKDITSTLVFNIYTIPSNIDHLNTRQLKNAITNANEAKNDNEAYNENINANHNHKVSAALLQIKKDYLINMVIELKYISTQAQVTAPGYPTYSQPVLTTATLLQVEQYIVDKLVAQNAAHAYNEKLKEEDKQIKELIRLRSDLKAIHIPSKVVFEGVTSTLIFNTYTIPSDIDDLNAKQLREVIINANKAKNDNEAYNRDINANHNHEVFATLLEIKKEILKNLVIPTKIIYIGATTALKFNPYVKPTNDEIDGLSIEGVNKDISKTNNAIHDNNLYNKAILEEVQKANDRAIAYLRIELNSLILLKQTRPNPGVVMVLSFDHYKPVNINSMSEEQLKIAIGKVKEANKNNENYNNEANTKNKEQIVKINKLKSIASTMISEKIATSTDIPTHKFEKYTLPSNLESLTIIELEKEIVIAQQVVINDKIYNEEVIASNKNAKVAAKILQNKKKILLSIEQPKELTTSFKITMTIHFENYTLPTDLDSLSLEQINYEITIANNIKNHNNRYNNLLKSKIIAVQALADEQTRINALTSNNVLAPKFIPLVTNGVFNDKIARLYGLAVTLKSNFTYSY
ncbi:MAG: hypothetical protein KAG14_02405, partial [Mycoplasmataceae bacterium]|nr:hypothetical protein [Mycoplasmataceae bacterium]